MSRKLKHVALRSIALHDGGSLSAPRQHGLRSFKDQITLGIGGVVARQTILTKNWKHFFLKVHGTFMFDRSDRNLVSTTSSSRRGKKKEAEEHRGNHGGQQTSHIA